MRSLLAFVAIVACVISMNANANLAFDDSGNLFVYDGPNTIFKVTSDGRKSTFAQNRPEPVAAESEHAAEEEPGADSSVGLPENYAKNYLIASATLSPDKEFAVIYPNEELEDASKEKNYLVALQPFSILRALETKSPYFQHESHGGLSAEWSDDSSVALITLDGKWGPRDVFLVEIRDGKLSRMTNILKKSHDLLLPNYRKAKAERYNEYFDFIFESEDEPFCKLDGTSRVVIDAEADTSPNDLGLSPRAWHGHVEAVWDIAQAKFTSDKVSGQRRGADAYRNRAESDAEDKQYAAAVKDIQKAIELESKNGDYYLDLAWYQLFNRKPRESIAASLKALEFSPDYAVMIKTNLAHGYLLDNQFDKAKAIYLENKDAKLPDDERTLSQAVLDDFKELQDAGITIPTWRTRASFATAYCASLLKNAARNYESEKRKRSKLIASKLDKAIGELSKAPAREEETAAYF
jgi:tetratricopeptide (TPR) repeat protein